MEGNIRIPQRDILHVKKMLGHRNINSTLIYVDLEREISKLGLMNLGLVWRGPCERTVNRLKWASSTSPKSTAMAARSSENESEKPKGNIRKVKDSVALEKFDLKEIISMSTRSGWNAIWKAEVGENVRHSLT